MQPDATGTIPALTKALPKVLLHEHLDGGLRPATLLELLRERGIEPPAADVAGLEDWFDARAHAGSLTEYLRGFALTVAAMASPRALDRVAFEAAEDARLDGCVLAEFRIAPLLFEPHGIDGEAAVEALLAGLARSPLPSGLIVCAMRHHPAAEVERSARLGVAYRDAGVVGFDLAGPEAGHPPSVHAAAIGRAIDGGLGFTCHAGEADVAERIVEAGRLGARRIGHGVRLIDALDAGDAALLDEVRDRGLHLELCPTSNVHTGAAACLSRHPIGPLWRAGVDCSFHTDNRLISRISHSGEAANLLQEVGLSETDLVQMGRLAARASFLSATARGAAEAALQRWGEWRGIRPTLPARWSQADAPPTGH